MALFAHIYPRSLFFFRAAARKKGSKRGRRTLFGGEVLYNVSSLAGL